jgi:hypothetical protein
MKCQMRRRRLTCIGLSFHYRLCTTTRPGTFYVLVTIVSLSVLLAHPTSVYDASSALPGENGFTHSD